MSFYDIFFFRKENSKSEPDFIEAGVELKVTPFKLNKNRTYSSKERLVLNMINIELSIGLSRKLLHLVKIYKFHSCVIISD